MANPPDRATALYALIDAQGKKIAVARADHSLSAQQRSERTRAASAIIIACWEELRALRIARTEATDCLNMPDAKEASLIRMVEPHQIAQDGAPELHRRLVNHLTLREALSWLATTHPHLAQLLSATHDGWRQQALAHVHGVDQATISRRISRARHLLAARTHSPD